MTALRFTILLLVPCLALAKAPRAPLVDHHQHLMSVTMSGSAEQAINGKKLIASLDDAGLKRAVVLSNAFAWGNPRQTPFADEYDRVRAENDWTLDQATPYSKRVVVFCSFNPLKDYALTELERCAADPRFGRGIKLQFAASDVNLDSEEDVNKVRRIFQAANAHGLAIVVHMRTRRAKPYGAVQAQTFIDKLLSAAPDVAVQIAHFTGGANPDDKPADEALGVFIDAIRRGDPRVRNLYFDTALIIAPNDTPERKQWLADRIREIGPKRMLYGSDGGDPTDPPPRVQVEAFHSLPLTPAEFKTIDRNVAPYLR